MDITQTIVVGAGQAGLAVSNCLTERGHEHVVLERGRVAERWLSERWDSLRLLTPNWMTRLPGYRYAGPQPDGFMTAHQTARFFGDYATSFGAPIREHSEVTRIAAHGDGFEVATATGTLRSDQVVIATGWCDQPAIPAIAGNGSPRIHQIVPTTYRNPSQIPPGGVLVVGASATGVQIAAELRREGRPVALAVGSHRRVPRRYRGLDSFWWLDQLGSFDRTVDDVDDVWAARTEPALQLVGHPDHADLDLPRLQTMGVALFGRLAGLDGTRAYFQAGVAATISAADEQMSRLLTRIDALIERSGLTAEVLEPEPVRTVQPFPEIDSFDLVEHGIHNIVWATGYRRRYHWLELPILDERGEIRQYRGVTPVSGAYVLGQRFQHFRNSNFIDGVGRDAEFVADHIVGRAAKRGGHLRDQIGGRL